MRQLPSMVIVILLRCCDRICCKSRESRESRCLGPIKFLRMVSGSMHKATQLSVPFLLVLSVCQGAEHVGFTKDVLPVFQRHCFECHGPDVQEGGLRFDDRNKFLAGGYSGPAIISVTRSVA